MNEPKRWLEGGDAGEEALTLLRAARPPAPLGAAARSRSSRRVAALGVGALPVAAAFGWWPALALGALIGASGSLGVTRLLASDPPTVNVNSTRSTPATKRTESPAAAPRLELQQSPAPSPPEQAAPERAPRAPTAAAVATAPVPEPASADALQEEVKLLEQARRDLTGSPGAARLTLLEHERRFPSGHLRIERELLLVDALVHLGRRPEAETRAASLERQAPNSLYRERLDQILGRLPR